MQAATTPSAPRFTLRQLPLPAKLVVTLFMLVVGLGYFSALVQMHFQHTQGDGTPMPGVNDVIEIFAGKKWITREEAAAVRPKSKLETLVTASRESWSGNTGMSAAFFHKDPTGVFNKLVDKRNPDPQVKAKVEAEREGERKVVELWSRLPADQRRAAYESDKFISKEEGPTSLTEEFFVTKGVIADGAKVKSILTARCAECHQVGGAQAAFPLDTYAGLAKYLEAPPGVEIPDGQDGAWCVSTRQIGREKLAQSTHAHLLSFAMLFALTGLVFSFTSWPFLIRLVGAPIVLLAQVADVSCWWLARIDGPGIYFAQAIMATVAVVGLGLGAQIVLSVFNMYGIKGKFVLVLLFLGAAAGGGLVAEKYAKPFLADMKAKKEKEAAEAAKGPPLPVAPPPEPAGKKVVNPPNPGNGPTRLEKLFVGKWQTAPWPEKGNIPEGAMVRALFDKETEFKKAQKEMKQNPAEFERLVEEREGERAVTLAWIKAKAEDRKKAFEKDEFPLPAELKGKPFTADYFANDKAVKIKTMLEERCSSCHGGESKVPLEKYEDFEKYLK
jgi:hypothetical protein